MRGKTIVITGATSGIGAAAAHALAMQGARIVFIARDLQRGQTTLAKLRSIAPGIEHRAHYADLSRLDEMKRVAIEIANQEPHIDVLINNAGVLLNSRQVTLEGFEVTFAINHLSYFVVTHLLRDRLAPDARIVNTASRAHARGTMVFDDLQSARRYVGLEVYNMTKLCNVLFTRELAKRLAHTNITVNCLSPGFVATRWGANSGGLAQRALGVAKVFARTPQKGAETMIYLAASPEVAKISGAFFHDCKQREPSDEARNEEIAQRLWEMSMKMAGLERK
jgi:NAD(P)-dependent dehydrogenase (short-subunit alcohol dehydrogenase family)